MWGAPLGSPGQSYWHPRMKEQDHIGWIVDMHLLRAVERTGEIMENKPDWIRRAIEEMALVSSKDVRLPEPVVCLLDKAGSVPSLMHGVPLMTE